LMTVASTHHFIHGGPCHRHASVGERAARVSTEATLSVLTGPCLRLIRSLSTRAVDARCPQRARDTDVFHVELPLVMKVGRTSVSRSGLLGGWSRPRREGQTTVGWLRRFTRPCRGMRFREPEAHGAGPIRRSYGGQRRGVHLLTTVSRCWWLEAPRRDVSRGTSHPSVRSTALAVRDTPGPRTSHASRGPWRRDTPDWEASCGVRFRQVGEGSARIEPGPSATSTGAGLMVRGASLARLYSGGGG
jgi:hypothetical protein